MSAGKSFGAWERLDHVLESLGQKPGWVLGFVVLFTLGPFIGKPFNMDDPLFIWAAQHIQAHPLNPYGFTVNWYGFEQPMWEVTKNPPLASYYLAAWAGLSGWSEPSLHAALLLPALAAVLGTHRLATKLCQRPLLAALATLFTPVFLVSSTMVMCDVLMLAFWVWAMVLWMEGEEKGRPAWLAAAAVLIGLAALTKYFGACLAPLLAVWSLSRRRPFKLWLPWLAIPVAMLVAYQFATHQLYGRGLLSDAGGYVAYAHQLYEVDAFKRAAMAMSFLGGCVAVIVFFAPLLTPMRWLTAGVLGIGLLVFALYRTGWLIQSYVTSFGVPRFALALQLGLWMAAGISVLALGAADLRRRRDAGAWLLNLWLWGTLVFSAFFNWIVTARTLLPLAPAVGILLARRLEAQVGGVRKPIVFLPPLALSATLALAVARADFLFAAAVHENVAQISNAYPAANGRLWFQGHWGFQYYMQFAGARALDTQSPTAAPGDLIALPSHNTNLRLFNAEAVTTDRVFRVAMDFPLSTQSPQVGGGFYASLWGPLPFGFGRVPGEETTVYVLKPSVPNPARLR